MRSLAMVADIVHGAPCHFVDPARFSLAHGGKDRQPFPVLTTVYDQTIRVIKRRLRRPGSAVMENSPRWSVLTIRPAGSKGMSRLEPFGSGSIERGAVRPTMAVGVFG